MTPSVSATMKLHLKRLFEIDDRRPHPAEQPKPVSSPRSAKRRLTFVTLAGVLAIVGALAGGYYFAMRPVTLRIAVGPANSDDLKVVQTLTQAFNNQRAQPWSGCARCRPTARSRAPRLLGDGKADLAIIRGDLDVPKNAQAVATLRKNVAVLWVPPAARSRARRPRPTITRSRSSPAAASASSAAPRPTSICSR